MSILRILTFCLLLFAGNAFSQGFLRSYTPESSMAREILQTADGGYFLAGQVSNLQSLFLARTNEFGQILWENHIPINQSRAIASCAATDGGFFILLENLAVERYLMYWFIVAYFCFVSFAFMAYVKNLLFLFDQP